MNDSIIIETIEGMTKSYGFSISLVKTEFTYQDVENIFFTIKKELTDPDDSLILLSKLNGQITDSTPDSTAKTFNVYVEITKEELEKLVVGKEYNAGLFVKFNGQDAANEDVKQKLYFKKLQGTLNDN